MPKVLEDKSQKEYFCKETKTITTMTGGAIIFGILLIGIYALWVDQRELRNEKEEAYQQLYNRMKTNQSEKQEQDVIATRDYACSLLRQENCIVTTTENDYLQFDYQGGTFLMDADNNHRTIIIHLPWCFHCSSCDIDSFVKLRKTINMLNMATSYQFYYTEDNDMDEIYVHIKRTGILIPQMPQPDFYLRSLLDGFFRAQRALIHEFENAECRL